MFDPERTMTSQLAEFLRAIQFDKPFTAATVVDHFDQNLTGMGRAIAQSQAGAALSRFCQAGAITNTGSSENRMFVYKISDLAKIPIIKEKRPVHPNGQNPYDSSTFGVKTKRPINGATTSIAKVPKPLYDAVESVILDYVPQIALRIAQTDRGLAQYTTAELLAEIQRRI